MMEAITSIDIHTEHDKKDLALCGEVSAILNKHYPKHLWMVGCDHASGMIYVELPYATKIMMFPYGFSLHIPKLGSVRTMKKKVVWAGGELLERFKLKRGMAADDVIDIAKQNGLDTSGSVG